jgi:SagB-type dehydrogenase family enzyme
MKHAVRKAAEGKPLHGRQGSGGRVVGPGRVALLVGLMLALSHTNGEPAMAEQGESVNLPAPQLRGDISLEEALQRRRSVRERSERRISLQQAGQLLWAAQGETDSTGLRASPSAGALYPLELYLVAGAVTGLEPGVYQYRADGHRLVKIAPGDHRRALGRAALDQPAVSGAAAVIAIGAVYQRTTGKYGNRGRRYVHMEAGHAAQNVLLQATALGLHSLPTGAFDDATVQSVVAMKDPTRPLYLLPIGRGE